MAMDKAQMANAIINALSNIDDPDKARAEFSKAIQNYLQDNMEIEFIWSATLPPPSPPTPDTVTSYTGKISFPVFSLPPIPDMVALGPLVTLQLVGGLITPNVQAGAPPTLVVPTTTLLPIPVLLTQSNADNQKDAMEHFCKELIDGIKKMVNPVPLPGINPPYVLPAPGAIMKKIS